jgi:hypothetical protein
MGKWSTLLLLAAAPLAAQPAVEYAQAVAGRMRLMREPVVAAHGLGRVAGLVCGRDRIAGTALFQEAARALDALKPGAFVDHKEPLPVPSFTALFRAVRAAAVRCDPALAGEFDTDRAQARMRDERRQANDMLRRAEPLIARSPDRAAQMAQAAISTSTPELLDVAELTLLLSKLRDRAPDLADELFADTLDFIVSAPDPSPAALMELGKFVFVAPKLWEEPDKDQRSLTAQVGGAEIVHLGSIRRSAVSEDAKAFTEAVLKLIAATDNRNYHATIVCALARQMLPYAAVGPDALEELKRLYVQLAARADANAPQIHAALGLAPLDLGAIGPPVYEGVAAIFAAIEKKQFAEARQLAKIVANGATRAQAVDAVDFAEAADAIAKKDLAWATTLANGLAAGVKRVLLYAGIAAAAPDREAAFGVIQLALKDIAGLPSEHQMFTLAACAAAVLRIDPDTGMTIVAQHVTAANDTLAYPRRRDTLYLIEGVPRRATILFNRRGLAEVVAAPAGRFRYPLRVPGVTALTLPALVREAKDADPARVEAAILGLRSEKQLADGLSALAETRLR